MTIGLRKNNKKNLKNQNKNNTNKRNNNMQPDQHASDEKYNFEWLEDNVVLQNQKLIW